eukprot:gene23628-biopygen17839
MSTGLENEACTSSRPDTGLHHPCPGRGAGRAAQRGAPDGAGGGGGGGGGGRRRRRQRRRGAAVSPHQVPPQPVSPQQEPRSSRREGTGHWREHGAGVARAIGYRWLGWRGRGAGEARACPVPPAGARAYARPLMHRCVYQSGNTVTGGVRIVGRGGGALPAAPIGTKYLGQLEFLNWAN